MGAERVSRTEAEEMRAITMRNAGDAPLPVKYEAAKTALAECEAVDECRSWAKKAAALASYARQAKDDSLEKMATRIRARAVKRAGDLLNELPADAHRPRKGVPDTTHQSERDRAAKSAGMSDREKHQALRVSNVPQEEFEAAVESETPPSIAELEERGTCKKVEPLVDLQGRDPEDFNRSLHLGAEINRLAVSIETMTPKQFTKGCLPRHLPDLRKSTKALVAWLTKLSLELEET